MRLALALVALCAAPPVLQGCSVACGCSPPPPPGGTATFTLDGDTLSAPIRDGFVTATGVGVVAYPSGGRVLELRAEAGAAGTYALGPDEPHRATWRTPAATFTTDAGGGELVLETVADGEVRGRFAFHAGAPDGGAVEIAGSFVMALY